MNKSNTSKKWILNVTTSLALKISLEKIIQKKNVKKLVLFLFKFHSTGRGYSMAFYSKTAYRKLPTIPLNQSLTHTWDTEVPKGRETQSGNVPKRLSKWGIVLNTSKKKWDFKIRQESQRQRLIPHKRLIKSRPKKGEKSVEKISLYLFHEGF